MYTHRTMAESFKKFSTFILIVSKKMTGEGNGTVNLLLKTSAVDVLSDDFLSKKDN